MDIKDKIWAYLESVKPDSNITVVIGEQDKPRPKLPYIVFWVSYIGNNSWDALTFDDQTSERVQQINKEALVTIRAIGTEDQQEVLWNIYAAAGNQETQHKLEENNIAIYDRTAPSDRPYIGDGEILQGAEMTLKIRHTEEYRTPLQSIETLIVTGEYKAGKNEYTSEIQI